MKSEERHHLAENDLNVILSSWQKKIVPRLNQILIGLLVVLVVMGGYLLWRRSSSSKDVAGWSEFIKSSSADDYATVADRHEGTELGRWARPAQPNCA